MVKILFVCLGNICRSPMAEAVFKHKVNENNLADRIIVGSAATGDWNTGSIPHQGTLDILKEHNIPAENMFATQITLKDFENYDYIVGMDNNNIKDIKCLVSNPDYKNKVHSFLSIVEGSEYTEVPDPYYTGDFHLTYYLIERGTDAWLEKLKQALK